MAGGRALRLFRAVRDGAKHIAALRGPLAAKDKEQGAGAYTLQA